MCRVKLRDTSTTERVKTHRRSVYSRSFSVLTMLQDNAVRVCTDRIPASKEHGTKGICCKVEKPRGCDERREKMWVCGLNVCLSRGQRSLATAINNKVELAVESRAQGAHRDQSKSVNHIQRLRFPVISRCFAMLCLNETTKCAGEKRTSCDWGLFTNWLWVLFSVSLCLFVFACFIHSANSNGPSKTNFTCNAYKCHNM